MEYTDEEGGLYDPNRPGMDEEGETMEEMERWSVEKPPKKSETNMREIKFRAWDRNNHNTIEWDGLQKMPFRQVFSSTLIPEQFTGLHDKNGKEIYEGDIIEGRLNVSGSYEVKYLPEAACFVGVQYVDALERIVKEKQYHFIFSQRPILTPDWEVEIVGNIHESPELIK